MSQFPNSIYSTKSSDPLAVTNNGNATSAVPSQHFDTRPKVSHPPKPIHQESSHSTSKSQRAIKFNNRNILHRPVDGVPAVYNPDHASSSLETFIEKSIQYSKHPSKTCPPKNPKCPPKDLYIEKVDLCSKQSLSYKNLEHCSNKCRATFLGTKHKKNSVKVHKSAYPRDQEILIYDVLMDCANWKLNCPSRIYSDGPCIKLSGIPTGSGWGIRTDDQFNASWQLLVGNNPDCVTLEQARLKGDTFAGNVNMGGNDLTNGGTACFDTIQTNKIEPKTGTTLQIGDPGDTVTIKGALIVDGSTTSLNTTVLESEDANIELNKGGNEAAANIQKSGFTVTMTDATNAQIGYDSTSASKFCIGPVGDQHPIWDSWHGATGFNKTLCHTTNDIGGNKLIDKSTGNDTEYKQVGATATTGHVLTVDGSGDAAFAALPVVSHSMVGVGPGKILKVDPDTVSPIEYKSITAGTGMTLVNGADNITLNVTPVSHTNVGTGLGKVVKGAPTSTSPIEHKSIKAGTGVTVVNDVNDITVNATPVVHSMVGAGVGKILENPPDSTSPITYKSIATGSNVSITNGATDITINADAIVNTCLQDNGTSGVITADVNNSPGASLKQFVGLSVGAKYLCTVNASVGQVFMDPGPHALAYNLKVGWSATGVAPVYKNASNMTTRKQIDEAKHVTHFTWTECVTVGGGGTIDLFAIHEFVGANGSIDWNTVIVRLS